eukprot:s1227_g19.t1
MPVGRPDAAEDKTRSFMQMVDAECLHDREAGRVACVKLLLNAHANVNTRCLPNTPLSVAAESGNATLVGLLLEARACTERRYQSCDPTALMLASRNGHVTVAAQLVAARASLNAWDSHDLTALHFAALHDQVDIARFLLASRARVNVPDREGESPLAADLCVH